MTIACTKEDTSPSYLQYGSADEQISLEWRGISSDKLYLHQTEERESVHA